MFVFSMLAIAVVVGNGVAPRRRMQHTRVHQFNDDGLQCRYGCM